MIVLSNASVIVLISVKDENGDVVTPDSASWSLLDENGDVVNSREDVSLTPDDEMAIVLNDDDLPFEDDNNILKIHVEAEYESVYGPLKVRKVIEVVVKGE